MQNFTISCIARLMRISLIQATIAMTLGGVVLAEDNYGQLLDQKVTVKYRKETIVNVLSGIENQTSIRFAYSGSITGLDDKVTIEVSAASLREVLDELLKPRNINYSEQSDYIVLSRAPDPQKNETAEAFAHIVTGTVLDGSNNDPLPGVNIIIKGTANGTTTDNEGKFSLSTPDGGATLVFSFIGYASQEVEIGERSIIDIALMPDVRSLNEVVVVGYGTIAKSELTGAISTVSTEKTRDIPNTNVLQSLQGRVPGLNVTTPDRPGEDPDFIIRGTRSISAGNGPLVVVDGIIYNGSVNDFNVNDIEKVDILRDASAAAVYGSRSANGVIIITTKMGKTEKPTLNFSTYYGVSTPVYLVPVLDGPGYLQKILDFREASGLEADPNKIENYLSVTEAENYRNVETIDWYDRIIKAQVTQSYDLNISGKTDRTSYFLSGNYFRQDGIVANDNFKRKTVKANFKNNITDWYSISLKSAFASKDYSGVEAGLYYGLSPYGNYWEDEAKGVYKEFPMEDTYFTHPMINTFIDNKNTEISLLALASSELNVPFIKGLKWTLNYSTNLRDSKVYNFWDNTMQAGDGKTKNGRAKKEDYENYDWTLDNIVNFKREFLKVHAIDVTLLYSREYRQYEETIAEANDFTNQALGYNNLSLAQVQQTSSDFENQNSVAYMARLNYVYNDKYLLTATVRKDGFSGFAEGNKYAVFPSVALGWTASNEDFMKNIPSIDLLKFRISYGVNGNQALGRYQTLARIANSQYIFGDDGSTVTTSYIESMANNDLGWETTRVQNIGIDFGLFNNRLNGSIDAYSSNTQDVLLKRNIPTTSGYSTVWTNIGKVHNHGVEISLNSTNVRSNGLTWETGVTFALNRNKIVELLGEDLDGDGKEDDNVSNSWFIGKPLGVIYGYKTDGIYQLNDTDIPSGFQAGDFRLVDITGDGELTPDDRTILGSTLPNYMFSISSTLKYKNFSLYVLVNSIQGGGKDNYYAGNNMAMHNVNNYFESWTERFNFQDVPYWTPDNPSNEYSRINYIPTLSHPYLEDRSFVRLQDITLSYTFDQSILKKLGLLGLRTYVSSKNLYTWTKWTGYDPENRTSIGGFPMLRTFTLGVDLRF